jgi:hypothetical protein
MCVPKNTPATPPNLEYLENAFSKLNSKIDSQLMDMETQQPAQQLPQAQSLLHSQHEPIEINRQKPSHSYEPNAYYTKNQFNSHLY